jgi:carbamoyl-phosphate synthase large subunit
MPQTVLVTGAGGPAGVSVIQALRAGSHRTVGADASPDAVGLRLADRGAVLPYPTDPGYAEAVVDLALACGVTALIPTVAEELVALSMVTAALDGAGIAHWLPSPQAVESCTDKWRFHLATSAAGVAVPPTGLGTAEGIPGPWVVKPRFGRGSRDVHLTDDPAELPHLIARVPDPLVQHRLAGREFTVDTLVDHKGAMVAAVPRWRDETKAGISVRGETFEHRALVRGVAALLGALSLTGPANVQGFVALDAPLDGLDDDGVVAFIEVNPRFSGGLPLSIGAGADLVGQYLRGMLGLSLEPDRLRYRSGVRMFRYFEEIFEEPS